MSVWSKLFGDKNSSAGVEPSQRFRPPTPGNPCSLSAVPGKVEVSFHAHEAAEGARGQFLTAVTAGLAKYKQRELAITLRLESEDEVPGKMQEIGRFFATVYNWTREGHIVNAGELTQFGTRGLFGRANSGLLYANARPLRGVELPENALAAVLVDEAEVKLAMAHGAYRVLTRIGVAQRHFPFPTFSDLARESVATAREGESLLGKVHKTRTRGATFLVEGERARVLLLPSVRRELMASVSSLSPGAPFALLIEPSARANAVLVWAPGQTEPKAISPDGSDGSCLSGCFLMVVPGAPRDQARSVEDGYSLLFREDSWATVAAALAEARPLRWPMADDITLEIAWQGSD